MVPNPSEQRLLDKIRSLPPGKLAEVEDFVDCLVQRESDGRATEAVTRQSEAAFSKVWDNPEDDDYDEL